MCPDIPPADDAQQLQSRLTSGEQRSRRRFVLKINQRAQESTWTARVATLGLCAVIALAPLPFGSVQVGPIVVWVALLSIVILFAQTGPMSRRDTYITVFFALVSVCWTAVVAVQSVDTPVGRQFLHPIWVETALILGVKIAESVSAVRDAPLLNAGAQIACALAFLSGYFAGRDRRAARTILKVFAGSSLAYAAYGIATFVVAPDHVLWLEKVAYRNVLTATFINANTAAVYFGAASIAWLMLMLEAAHRSATPRKRHWRHVQLRYLSRRATFRFFAFLISLAAAFMSGSRLGSALSLFAIIGAVGVFYRARLNNWRAASAGVVFAVGVTIAVFLVLGGRVNQRIDIGGLTDGMRFQTYLSTGKIIQDFPLLGTGLGTFRWVFPAYRSSEVSVTGIWDRAHSTTLELAAEMGIPFLTLIVIAWLQIMLVLAHGMVHRRQDDIIATSAFWISATALLHSQWDFSLQIPGFAIVVLALAGMGVAQSASRKERLIQERLDSPNNPP